VHHQQDQEDDEQHIRNVHRKARDTPGAKSAGDKSEHEKDKSPTKHERSFQAIVEGGGFRACPINVPVRPMFRFSDGDGRAIFP
jgi:hypothetical protein